MTDPELIYHVHGLEDAFPGIVDNEDTGTGRQVYDRLEILLLYIPFHYDYLGKVVDMTEQVDERFLVAQDIHICVYLLAGFKFVGIIIGYVYVASQDIIEIVLQMLYSFWIFPVSVKNCDFFHKIASELSVSDIVSD